MSDPIHIPAEELCFSYARSSGPGGQNVNKVNSKAILHWNAAATQILSDDSKQRFLAKNRHRLTNEGEIVISSQRYRDQPRNAADCIEKLQQLITSSLSRPKPRKKTKPSRASGERRLKEKRSVSQRKQSRRAPADHD